MGLTHVKEKTLEYVEKMRVKEQPYGRYCCNDSSSRPVLYASTYAAMTKHLYGDLKNLSERERKEWVIYLQSYQEENGLFTDPIAVNSEFWKEKKWNNYGQLHFALHVIGAFGALGAKIKKPFRTIEPFKKKDYILSWLEARNWKDTYHTGNEIQNLMVLLQYARNFHKDKKAGEVVNWIFNYLDKKQISKTGLWGEESNTPEGISRQVQGTYHFLLLYLYDNREINYKERIVDSCLATQNEVGGFGVNLNSSACEDIDSIDPLARFSFSISYRREDIKLALKKTLNWVLSNQNDDGGFVFSRGGRCECGTSNIYSEPDESAMFPTWFRTLSLSYIGMVLPELVAGVNWNFMHCPGHQFWK